MKKFNVIIFIFILFNTGCSSQPTQAELENYNYINSAKNIELKNVDEITKLYNAEAAFLSGKVSSKEYISSISSSAKIIGDNTHELSLLNVPNDRSDQNIQIGLIGRYERLISICKEMISSIKNEDGVKLLELQNEFDDITDGIKKVDDTLFN